MVDLSALPEVLVGYYAAKGAFPQEVARLKKAIARIGGPALENLASRIKSNTAERKAISDINAEIIAAARNQALQIAADEGRVGRAIAHNVEDLIHKQSNREKILHLAVEQLSSNQDIENPDDEAKNDDDWLNAFSDMAAQKSNPDIQALWAKILAGEIRKPKSFSLQSLRLLSAIDADDAQMIHEILGLTINKTFIFRSNLIEDLTNFLKCEEIGILIGVSGKLNRTYNAPQPPLEGTLADPMSSIFFESFRSKVVVNFPPRPPGSKELIHIPQFNLTRFGRELLDLSPHLSCRPDYDEDFHRFLMQNGGTVNVLEMKIF